jgi:hypothetical protein
MLITALTQDVTSRKSETAEQTPRRALNQATQSSFSFKTAHRKMRNSNAIKLTRTLLATGGASRPSMFHVKHPF